MKFSRALELDLAATCKHLLRGAPDCVFCHRDHLKQEIQDLKHDIAALTFLLYGGKPPADPMAQKIQDLRYTLQELRIRMHAAGKRPETCYEMSMIDDALAYSRVQQKGDGA